jgi:AraC-like DNA-binding protein
MVQPTLIDAALRGALVALLVTVGVALWPQWRHAQRRDLARVGLGLAASLAVQALSSSPWAEYALECRWQAPGIAVSLGSAVWFWLFARALFDDGFRLRAWHLGLWAAVALLGGTVCEWRPALAGYAAMRAVPIVFALLSLVAVARQWRADLVERRRRWRALVIGGGGLYALGMVAARLHSPDGRLEPTAALVDVTMLLTLTGVIASRLLAPRAAGLWGEPAPVPVPAPPRRDPADEALAAALARWMGEQRGYAQEGLSLGSLAERLGAPEYRLRRVINQGLGHRNFNAYVNGLRLAEARRRLADPAERQLPVLSIALDVGFGSIGPFNRAFKAETGLTPTEFRERHLADS